MDDRGESRRTLARREQRRAGDRSARLANALMKLSATALSKLELDESLQAVAERARAVTAHVARRRAERSLAGALRGADLAELARKLANVEATGAAEPQQFHLAETWRTTLIEGGVAAATDFPGGAAAPLPRLIELAQRERDTGKPPGSARALFRHIVAVLKAQVPVTADGDDSDSDSDSDDDDDDDEADGDEA